MKLFQLVLAFSSVALWGVSAEASITMSPSDVYANLNDEIGDGVVQGYTGSSIDPPTHTTLNAVDGGNYSNNAIDWYVSSGQTILSLGMDNKRTGTQYSYSQSNADLYFSAISNDPYELSGYFNVTDVGAPGREWFYVQLYDSTDAVYLLDTFQNSAVTPNQQFVAGGTGGDTFNQLLGSLTGNLIAGHDYLLHASAFIHAFPEADSGASALGNITLKIGNATEAVPEPLSLLAWCGLGTLGVLWSIHKR